jgi:hypothetical protein
MNLGSTLKKIQLWRGDSSQLKVPEPTASETIQILKGLKECFDIHHKLR